MTDFFDITSIILVLSFSVSLGFFIKWFYLLVKIRSKANDTVSKACRHCMEAACTFFSVCIASAAVVIIATDWDAILASYFFEDYFYYFVIFISTLVFILFFRVLAPVFLGIYVLYCAVFAFLLIHSYSMIPKDYSFELSQGESLEFQTLTISYRNLLPLPRYWMSMPIVSSGDVSTVQEEEIFSYSISKVGEDSLLSTAIKMFSSLMLETNSHTEIIRIDGFLIQGEESKIELSVHVQDSKIIYETF